MSSDSSDNNDRSNGWEAVAAGFMQYRAHSRIGAATVRDWARSLPIGGSILDLGCGSGLPISEALMNEGFEVFGVEASPTLAEAFRRRFPSARIANEPVEESAFFGRTFDAAVAWGLMFLLPAETQRSLIRRVGRVLEPRGRFLFTAPSQIFSWPDASTGRTSVSLGKDAYRSAIEDAGLALMGELTDEGENHYYDAMKPVDD